MYHWWGRGPLGGCFIKIFVFVGNCNESLMRQRPPRRIFYQNICYYMYFTTKYHWWGRGPPRRMFHQTFCYYMYFTAKYHWWGRGPPRRMFHQTFCYYMYFTAKYHWWGRGPRPPPPPPPHPPRRMFHHFCYYMYFTAKYHWWDRVSDAPYLFFLWCLETISLLDSLKYHRGKKKTLETVKNYGFKWKLGLFVRNMNYFWAF